MAILFGLSATVALWALVFTVIASVIGTAWMVKALLVFVIAGGIAMLLFLNVADNV